MNYYDTTSHDIAISHDPTQPPRPMCLFPAPSIFVTIFGPPPADVFTFITVIFSAHLIYLSRIINWHSDILFKRIRAINVFATVSVVLRVRIVVYTIRNLYFMPRWR